MIGAVHRFAWFVVGFLAIAAVAQLASSYFFVCNYNDYQPHEYDPVRYCLSFGPLPVYDVVVWYRSLFEDISDLIIASFTIVVGISNIFLWLATRANARAAFRAADVAERALVDLERPYVFELIESHEEFVSDNGFSPQKFEVQMGFKNYGKMPAIIEEAVLDIKQFSHVPSSMTAYGEKAPTYSPFVLGSNAFNGPIKRACELTEAEMLDHQQDRLSVWIFGKVTYTDLAGNGFENEFRWRYNRSLSQYEERYRRNERQKK